MTPSVALLALLLALTLGACARPGDAGGQAPPKPPAAAGATPALPRAPQDLEDDSGEGLIDDTSIVMPMPMALSLEDAPRYATASYRKPALVEPNCVGRSFQPPAGLAARGLGQVVVKFAVDPAGRPSLFEILKGDGDPRLAAAISKAIEGCRWTPGADPNGELVSVWVILPIRFEAR